jgi:hypothetical protein
MGFQIVMHDTFMMSNFCLILASDWMTKQSDISIFLSFKLFAISIFQCDYNQGLYRVSTPQSVVALKATQFINKKVDIKFITNFYS